MLTIDGATGLVLRNFDLTDAINFNGYVNSGSTIGVYSVAVNAAGRAILASLILLWIIKAIRKQ
jgi:hypothetical protein